MSDFADNLAGLTTRQRLFVAAYLDCLNATEAARRAGYAKPRQQGSENLSKPNIAAAVQAGFAELAMPADEVIARLSAIGRADIRDLFVFDDELPHTDDDAAPPTGEMVKLKLNRSAPLHLIKSITPNRYGLKVELHDQQTALTTLARVHGLLNTFDWSKVPPDIVQAIAEGRMTIDDLKRLAATSSE